MKLRIFGLFLILISVIPCLISLDYYLLSMILECIGIGLNVYGQNKED
jgi:hypothetical protein